jgi:hypothetical protein
MFLLVTLTSLLTFSLIFTPLAICGYLTFRLVIHIRSGGRAGASQWATETKRRFVTPSKKFNSRGIEGSEASGSVVITNDRADSSLHSPVTKMEGDWNQVMTDLPGRVLDRSFPYCKNSFFYMTSSLETISILQVPQFSVQGCDR